MKARLRSTTKLITLVLLCVGFLSAIPQRSVQAAGLTPSKLLDEVYFAITSQGAVVNWKGELDPFFNVWVSGGSENLTVIAAVVGLFREQPSAVMPNSNVTYVNWLTQFLGSQTGQISPATPPRLRYFKNSELFSNIYDAPVVTAVLAVRYWAGVNNNPVLADYARRYLRASWAVYGLAAGSGPVRDHVVEGYNPPFFDDVTLRADGTYLYDGPFIALGGARSFYSHSLADDKQPLFGRASAWGITRTNENGSQKRLLDLLAQRWNLLQQQPEYFYAVTTTDQTDLKALANTGVKSSTFLQWILDIRTSVTYRIVAWTGVRASLMEYNPNGLTPNIYGIAYYAENQTSYFLYPWTEANGGGLPPGSTRMDSNRWWATNSPGKFVIDPGGQIRWTHPVKEVSIPIPSTAPLYHIVLSQNAPPYNEVTPPTNFPPPRPPEIDRPRNP